MVNDMVAAPASPASSCRSLLGAHIGVSRGSGTWCYAGTAVSGTGSRRFSSWRRFAARAAGGGYERSASRACRL